MTIDRRALRRSLRTDFNPSLGLRAKRALLRARQASHLPGLLAGGRLLAPVFVIGAPRSGSSLLMSILRSSSRLRHWPGEAHEVWEHDFHPALRGWDSNALDASDATPDTAARIRKAFFLVAGGRHRLIDKTPRNCLRVLFIDALFDDARFIFLHRDGRDNVNSLINAWRTPRYRTYKLPEPHSIPGVDARWWKFVLYPGWRADTSGPLERVCARQWATSNEIAVGDLHTLEGDRWCTTSYEDLIADPVTRVGELLDWLQLPYESQVKARAEAVSTTPINIVTPPEPGKWRRENPREIDAIRGIIDPVMDKLGYEWSDDED